jgi:ubiquitin carboxyl-terminal hydrolase 5/13
MTEMNLEFNLNLTLSKTIEDGKVLVPIYGEGNTGMENIGNSCYMNSIVQILFSLESFKEKFLDDSFLHLTTCLSSPEECFYCQVSKIFYGLYSGHYSKKLFRKVEKISEDGKITEEEEEYQKGVKPFSFKYFFAKDNAEFSSNRQQDAFEYLDHLFEKFNFFIKGKGLNVRLDFEFDLQLRLQCNKCNCVRYKNQNTWYLPLYVPDWVNKKEENSQVSLNEVLEKFLSPDVIQMNCDNCHEHTDFYKTQKIQNFPKYFIVLFQRFVYDWVPLKLDVQLKFNENDINLKDLSREHIIENEKVIEESNEKASDENENMEIEVDQEFDKDKINILLMNGVPELAAKHALINSNNNPEDALMWFYCNLESNIINQPIPKIKQLKNGKKPQNQNDKNFGLPISSINMLTEMGFTNTQAIASLKKNKDNPEKAMEFLFDNPDYDFQGFLDNLKNTNVVIDVDLKELNKNNNPNYSLYGKNFILFFNNFLFRIRYTPWEK